MVKLSDSPPKIRGLRYYSILFLHQK